MTVEQLLRAAGFGHRRTRWSVNTGKHDVYSLATGAVVGSFSAMEAAEFAEQQLRLAHCDAARGLDL